MKLLITGDLCPTEKSMPLFTAGDTHALFDDVTEFFQKSDRVIVNLECALTDHNIPIQKVGPNLKAVPNTAHVLAEAGITDCTLANNHVFDFGKTGLRDTIKHLEENHLFWTGAGENDIDSRKPHFIKVNGITIAVIAVCEHEYNYALPHRMGANPYDPYDTAQDIRDARKHADYVIVLYHGGKEFCRYPSPRLVKLCREMVRNGANVVLCQHSHCIGCYELFEGSHILYGQGNFHFVKDHQFEGWYTGFIVQLDFTDKCSITFLPVICTETGITLAKETVKENILTNFQKRNIELQDGTWIHQWHNFCESIRQDYTKAIAEAFHESSTEFQNQLFAHYLDCEAHSDVWHELFKSWNQKNETI